MIVVRTVFMVYGDHRTDETNDVSHSSCKICTAKSLLKRYKKMLKILPCQKHQPLTTPELSTAFFLFAAREILLQVIRKLYETV